MPVSHPDDLMRDVAELMRRLDRQRPTEADTVLDELVASSLNQLPGAQHAGITVAARDGSVHAVAATDHYPVVLDEIQQRHHQGPCLTAASEHQVIRVDDIAAELRWPAFCQEVILKTPVRSILAFQLFTTDQTTGALNFHADQPQAFDDDAVETGLALATHTALVWHMVRRDEQFRSALASRDVIGQAKGMIMERFDIDAVQAFELLKRLSQNSNTPLFDVAQRLAGRRSSGR